MDGWTDGSMYLCITGMYNHVYVYVYNNVAHICKIRNINIDTRVLFSNNNSRHRYEQLMKAIENMHIYCISLESLCFFML